MAHSGAEPSNEPRLLTFNFACGTLLHFALMLNYFSLMVIVTDYALSSFDAPMAVATTATGIFVIGALFARLATDVALRRLGLRSMLVLSAAVEVVCSVLYLAITDVAPLIALRALHGIAFGFSSTAASAVVTGSVPERRRGEGIGYFMLGSPLGAAVGPAASIALSGAFGYGAAFVFAICAAVVLLVLSILLRVPAREPEPVQHGRSVANHVSSAVEARAVPIGLVALLMYLAYSSLLAFMNSYVGEIGLGECGAWFFAVYATAMVVTRPFTGKAFDAISQHVAFVPAFFSFSIGMLVLWTAQSPLHVFVAAALMGYGVGSVQSCGLAVAVGRVEPSRVTIANSTYFMLLDAGVGAGPIIHGVFVSLFGKYLLWPSMAGVGVVAFVLYLFVQCAYARSQGDGNIGGQGGARS